MNTSHMFFDYVLIIDWTASATPKTGKDSLWVAIVDAVGDWVACTNPPTREAAMAYLAAWIKDHPTARMLLGFDFPFGYPAGFPAALGLPPTWEAVWQELAALTAPRGLESADRFAIAGQLNNRLGTVGPFWGHPNGRTYAGLTPRRKAIFTYPVVCPNGHSLAEYRVLERSLRDAGKQPHSVWKLSGAGCVGSQALLGIACLASLRDEFQKRIRVSPFETGLRVPEVSPGDVILAEVWPSMIDFRSEPGSCNDEKQVKALAKWILQKLDAGKAAELFAPTLTAEERAVCIREEGWVLGH